MEMTMKLAAAIGLDAGDRNMRSNNRTTWNEEDFSVASHALREAKKLIPNKGEPCPA